MNWAKISKIIQNLNKTGENGKIKRVKIDEIKIMTKKHCCAVQFSKTSQRKIEK